MCGEFGEVTVIIGLVINFLAFRLTIFRISWHLNICYNLNLILRMKDIYQIELLLPTW